MEFPEKLSTLRQTLCLTQEEMATRLGISSNYVSLLEKGRKEPSDAILRHVELIERVENTGLGGDAKKPDSTLGDDPKKIYGGKEGPLPRMVQVIGWAHAGQAGSYEELPHEWRRSIPTDCRDPKAFGVSLEGDSMEGFFREGDDLILMPSEEAHSGCYAVCRLRNDGVIFRRIEMIGDRIRLVPLNPRYEPTNHVREDFSWIYPIWERRSQLWKR